MSALFIDPIVPTVARFRHGIILPVLTKRPATCDGFQHPEKLSNLGEQRQLRVSWSVPDCRSGEVMHRSMHLQPVLTIVAICMDTYEGDFEFKQTCDTANLPVCVV